MLFFVSSYLDHRQIYSSEIFYQTVLCLNLSKKSKLSRHYTHFDLATFLFPIMSSFTWNRGKKRFVINTVISCFIHKYMNIIKI